MAGGKRTDREFAAVASLREYPSTGAACHTVTTSIKAKAALVTVRAVGVLIIITIILSFSFLPLLCNVLSFEIGTAVGDFLPLSSKERGDAMRERWFKKWNTLTTRKKKNSFSHLRSLSGPFTELPTAELGSARLVAAAQVRHQHLPVDAEPNAPAQTSASHTSAGSVLLLVIQQCRC